MQHWIKQSSQGRDQLKKKRFLSGIAQMRGGGLPMPEFFGPFSRSAFLVNKKSLFLQKCQCFELLTVFQVVNISPSPPHIFANLFFVSLPLNRGTINNSMGGNFYTSSAGRCAISDTVSQVPAAATQCRNIQVPTVLQQEVMQSLLLVRQCRHPAVHRMRLYIWINPSHPPF